MFRMPFIVWNTPIFRKRLKKQIVIILELQKYLRARERQNEKQKNDRKNKMLAFLSFVCFPIFFFTVSILVPFGDVGRIPDVYF